METFFIPALAVFLVATVIVMVIARRKDPRPSRAYTAISVIYSRSLLDFFRVAPPRAQ